MSNEQIRIAWNEAEEIHSSLNELTDEEVIECKVALKDRAYNIMSALSELVEEIEND